MNYFQSIRRSTRIAGFMLVLLAAPGHAQLSTTTEVDTPGTAVEDKSIRPFRFGARQEFPRSARLE